MLDQPESTREPEAGPRQRRFSRPKPAPYQKQFIQAQQRKEERDRRQQAFEEANRQRQTRREDSEKFRKQLDKARRPGRDGQRRLGRESKFLPNMVENLLKKLDEQKNGVQSSR